MNTICCPHCLRAKEKCKCKIRNRGSYTQKFNFNRKDWDQLRNRILDQSPLCAICKLNGKLKYANVVDHKIPHRGNEKLFWDESNLQSLCQQCHNKKSAMGD